MFWRKKKSGNKNKAEESQETISEADCESEEDNLSVEKLEVAENFRDTDKDVEFIVDSGEDIFEEIDGNTEELFMDTVENIDENGETSDTDEQTPAKTQVTKKIGSIDELADFANEKSGASLIFMNRETHEVFDLKEVHIRMSEHLGTVMMIKQWTESDLERLMLAKDVTENKDAYYIVPTLDESEIKGAMADFADEYFGNNTKKYTKNYDKFASVLKQNDLGTEWKIYTKAVLYDKLTEFCEQNGIVFED